AHPGPVRRPSGAPPQLWTGWTMNAPETIAQRLARTREPLPASRKTFAPGELHPAVRVPMREVGLSNGERVTLYDTSGPYTDPAADIDVRRGLADLRAEWIASRGDTETYESGAPHAEPAALQ